MLKNTHFEVWGLEWARYRHDVALEIKWLVHKRSVLYVDPFCFFLKKIYRYFPSP